MHKKIYIYSLCYESQRFLQHSRSVGYSQQWKVQTVPAGMTVALAGDAHTPALSQALWFCPLPPSTVPLITPPPPPTTAALLRDRSRLLQDLWGLFPGLDTSNTTELSLFFTSMEASAGTDQNICSLLQKEIKLSQSVESHFNRLRNITALYFWAQTSALTSVSSQEAPGGGRVALPRTSFIPNVSHRSQKHI